MRVVAALRLRARSGARTASAAGTELAVVVVVDSLDPVVSACRDRYDPGARAGMPPHVTVLYPVTGTDRTVDALHNTLSHALEAHRPFAFRLHAIGRFPGVVYLAPEPAAPLVDLTETVSRALGIAPYGGRFNEVVPHLTVATRRRIPRRAVQALEAALPLQVVAREVHVFGQEDGVWTERCTVPLGPVGHHRPPGRRHPTDAGTTQAPASASGEPLQER